MSSALVLLQSALIFRSCFASIRRAAEAELRQAAAGIATLTRQQVQALIEECADVARDLCDAEPVPGVT